VKLRLQATAEEVMRAVDALQELADQNGASAQIKFGLALALEESASNVVNYALTRDPAQSFEVVLDVIDQSLCVELRDDGPPFDPMIKAETEPVANDGDPPGGWGIQLARRHVETMTYSRDGSFNVLRFSSRLKSPEA
jgi:anti-sigma regulatory factor (Ser/Thr protein kinase)